MELSKSLARLQTEPMQELIGNAANLEWVLAPALMGTAVLVWKWRRRMAERRIARGLRAYTTAAQVAS
jgi:hypothetical protein